MRAEPILFRWCNLLAECQNDELIKELFEKLAGEEWPENVRFLLEQYVRTLPSVRMQARELLKLRKLSQLDTPDAERKMRAFVEAIKAFAPINNVVNDAFLHTRELLPMREEYLDPAYSRFRASTGISSAGRRRQGQRALAGAVVALSSLSHIVRKAMSARG